MQNWLIVERPANWEVDKANNFSYFGVTSRFEKLIKTMKPGDKLFAYVTARSCFSDIRLLTKPGPRPLKGGGDYENSLPLCIDTEPYLILEPGEWLPVSEIRDELVLLKGRGKSWSTVFQSAPRKLDELDALLIERHLRSRAPRGRVE